MELDKVFNVCIALMGFYFAIRFRSLGKNAIEFRKRLNKVLPIKQPEQIFDETAVSISQILFLLIGIFFILVGVAKLLAS